ncbi:MAG: hypothetical protein AAF399_26500 [Bacteroidota bacterium]
MVLWRIFLLSLLMFVGSNGLMAQLHYQKAAWDLGKEWTEEQVQAEIRQHISLLSDTKSDLDLLHRIESPGGVHLTFEQRFQGIAVQDGGIKLKLNHEGQVLHFAAYLQEFEPVSESRHPGLQTQWEDGLKDQQQAHTIHSKARWLVQDGKLIPIVRSVGQSFGAQTEIESWVHAETGEMLMQADQSIRFRPMRDTSGRARIFNPDPITISETDYGQSFSDNDDQHSAVFEQLLDTVSLKGLGYSGGLFRLQGEYVTIEDIAPFSITPATSSDGDFFFTREDDGFEDVMVYFHMDSYQRYIQSIGFLNLQNGPFRTDPHGKSDLDQSVFVINNGNPYILFGDGGVDDGEDADVIIHEYGHALSYAAAPDTRSGQERKGLDEGLGDYFAAAYSYDQSPWKWYNLFSWDGHNEFWPGRDGISELTYPPNSTSIYTYGEIWAATMMQIRLSIGAEVTDRIQLEQMYALFPGMTLIDGANLIIDADSNLYDGAHTEVIRDYFCQRGILMGANCLPVSIEDRYAPEWKIFPSPSEGQLQVEFPRQSPAERWEHQHSTLQGHQLAPEILSQGTTWQGEFSLSPGVYLLQLRKNGQWIGSEKWLIQ